MGQVSDYCEYGNDLFRSTQGEELPAYLYMDASSLFHAVTWGQNSVVGYY
jgi:hypothetical protein